MWCGEMSWGELKAVTAEEQDITTNKEHTQYKQTYNKFQYTNDILLLEKSTNTLQKRNENNKKRKENKQTKKTNENHFTSRVKLWKTCRIFICFSGLSSKENKKPRREDKRKVHRETKLIIIIKTAIKPIVFGDEADV